jgi:hypothetical protein
MVLIFALEELLVHILEVIAAVMKYMDILVDQLVRLRFLELTTVDKHVLNAQAVEVDTQCSQVAVVKDTQLLHQLVVGVDSVLVDYLKLHTHNQLGD